MTNIRLVILFLGVALLGDLAAITYLVAIERAVPDVFVVTLGGLSGSLGTLLVPGVRVEGEHRAT